MNYLVRSMNGHTNVLLIVTLASRTPQAKPFNKENENRTYEHISLLCEKEGVNLYVSHFANTINSTAVLSWIFRNGAWNMVELPASEITVSYADLPQNFPEANELRNLLFNHGALFINDLQMSDILTDKMLTYKLLPDFIPPTFDTSEPDLSARLSAASNHPDLRTDKVIIKPRYGERGKGIEVIDLSEVDSVRVRNMKDYIVQPLIESQIGIPELNIKGRHDLRMLLHNNRIVQFYVRTPVNGSFISNKGHGGKLIYYGLEELPHRFRSLAAIIDKRLSQYIPRFYSIDIGVGQSNKIWIYELNTMPGIVWEEEDELDVQKNKDMHVVLTKLLSEATQMISIASPR